VRTSRPVGVGHDADLGCRLTHGGVLLGLVGQMVCSLNDCIHQGLPRRPSTSRQQTSGYTPATPAEENKSSLVKSARTGIPTPKEIRKGFLTTM